MEEIKQSYSFILYTDDHFLNTDEVRDILGNFSLLKKQIMKNQKDDEKFYNPILKDDSSDDIFLKKMKMMKIINMKKYMILKIWIRIYGNYIIV